MNSSVQQLKAELEEKNLKGIALDIDETLSWTISYWVEQLSIRFGNPENLSVQEIIEKYRYTQNVPYWQSEDAIQWMMDNIESNELQKDLPLNENANVEVDTINSKVSVVAYLTARPESVIEGTQVWLNKHNFPSATIIARPRSVEVQNGNEWKANVLKEMYPFINAIVDDNPGLIEFLPSDYKGTIYLYNYNSEIKSGLDVVKCISWEAVRREVLSRYQG